MSRRPVGHGDSTGVGEVDGAADPVAVLRIGTTLPVEGSNRPYFGFTVI
jgi:hypothetical protein